MKVLWLCNSVPPMFADELNMPKMAVGGWISGMLCRLSAMEDITIVVCFPVLDLDNVKHGSVNGVYYYALPQKNADPTKCNPYMEVYFEKILLDEKPDLIHIWGTEFPHTLSMVNVCDRLGLIDKAVINIQGVCSVIANHYLSALPLNIVKRYTFRDLIRHDNILKQREKFKLRGEFEVSAIKKVKHVIGRTTWDFAVTKQINPNINHHFCNEILRDEFYKHTWDLEKCEKHSIFMSQGSYPIKGVHFMLEAVPMILKFYPDTHLYVTGEDITKCESLKDKIRISSYGKYIKELISKYNIKDKVTFLGSLNESEMCSRFLRSNVFVSAASIENSPNSLCEAMILGVPCVASNVGGVADLLEHKKEGLLYQYDAPYMLAHYVCEVFGESELAFNISKAAQDRAKKTNDPKINSLRNKEIYLEILNK
ncbi:MAG: glycosyltransferase [Eubacteriales bacterium]